MGINLADHVAVFLPNFVFDKQLTFNPEKDFNISALKENVFKRNTGADWPDVRVYFLFLSAVSEFGKDISWILALDSRHFYSVTKPLHGSNSFVIGVALARPKSVGEIKLRSSDPFSPPVIDPRYLKHPDDVHTLKEG